MKQTVWAASQEGAAFEIDAKQNRMNHEQQRLTASVSTRYFGFFANMHLRIIIAVEAIMRRVAAVSPLSLLVEGGV